MKTAIEGTVVDIFRRRGDPLPDGKGWDYSQSVLLVDIGDECVMARTPQPMPKGSRVWVRPQEGDLMLTNGEWLLVPNEVAGP